MTNAAEIRSRIAALPVRSTASVRAVRREYSKRLAKACAAEVMAIARELLPSHRWVAYEIIQYHRAAMASVNAKQLTPLGQGMADWADVDCFARFLAGPAWLARQIPDRLIHTWARSKDRWWRRAALVATVELNRTAAGDAARTLRVCAMLASDRDDMVVKALSWALRELAKRDPASVRDFLATHSARLAPRVLREVRNKLTTGLKNP